VPQYSMSVAEKSSEYWYNQERCPCSVLSETSTQQDMHDMVHNARDCPLCTVLAARSAVETSPTQPTTVLSSRKSSHLAGMWGLLPRRR
jgi:hypothetical protein